MKDFIHFKKETTRGASANCYVEIPTRIGVDRNGKDIILSKTNREIVKEMVEGDYDQIYYRKRQQGLTTCAIISAYLLTRFLGHNVLFISRKNGISIAMSDKLQYIVKMNVDVDVDPTTRNFPFGFWQDDNSYISQNGSGDTKCPVDFVSYSQYSSIYDFYKYGVIIGDTNFILANPVKLKSSTRIIHLCSGYNL